MDKRAAIEAHGFRYIGSCNCEGEYQHKYKAGNIEIRHLVRRGIYRILKNKIVINTGTINAIGKAIEAIKEKALS